MNLASLPSDIIRQIFWTGQLPIESSRLVSILKFQCVDVRKFRNIDYQISSRWNTLALDPPSIALKQRFPSIDSFRWHINPDLSSTIAMDIPDHCVAYFGVARWWQYRFETSTYAGVSENENTDVLWLMIVEDSIETRSRSFTSITDCRSHFPHSSCDACSV